MSGPRDARWHVQPADTDGRRRLSEALGLSPAVAQVLINRGFADPTSAAAFLSTGFDRLADPRALAGMDRVIERLAWAARDRVPVAVYGDYDADGVTATALLVRALRRGGAQPAVYIPDRRAEGYG